jgi:hypothetical protein
MLTISIDVLLCPALGLLSLLKFVFTLISLACRVEMGDLDEVVILVSADCGIDWAGLLVRASTYDRALLVVGETRGWVETVSKSLAANASQSWIDIDEHKNF